MKPGWYIVNYHNVDYEDSLLTRAIGGTIRPDVFARQVAALASAGRFISVAEGQAQLESGADFDVPVFSLWFDDGYRGLLDHAQPVCHQHGVLPALSICSRFTLRTEMFWRAKMSYLVCTGQRSALRRRFHERGLDVPEQFRTWTLHNFTQQVADVVDRFYCQQSHEAFRTDSFRLFLTRAELTTLRDAGWTMTNHSAAHYPLSAGQGWDAVQGQFDECEALVRTLTPDNRYWVIPFGFGSDNYLEQLMARATVVEVGDRRNTPASWRSAGRLFRYAAPEAVDILSVLR